MSTNLSIFLIIVAILAIIYIVWKIRHSHMNISDSIYWIVFAILLLLFSIFPQIIIFIAPLVGIQSPQNLLYLIIIALLVFKIFLMAIKMSQMQDKITLLVQKVAIDEFEKEKREEENRIEK